MNHSDDQLANQVLEKERERIEIAELLVVVISLIRVATGFFKNLRRCECFSQPSVGRLIRINANANDLSSHVS